MKNIIFFLCLVFSIFPSSEEELASAIEASFKDSMTTSEPLNNTDSLSSNSDFSSNGASFENSQSENENCQKKESKTMEKYGPKDVLRKLVGKLRNRQYKSSIYSRWSILPSSLARAASSFKHTKKIESDRSFYGGLVENETEKKIKQKENKKIKTIYKKIKTEDVELNNNESCDKTSMDALAQDSLF